MIPFVSPRTGQSLSEKNGKLVSESGEVFPIVKGIPRFVSEDNYAAAFGLQWLTFSKTQIDSHNRMSLSKERLERCLGFPLAELKGKTILEVGCGAGRFTELFAKAGALVHSVDLSVAIEASKSNVGDYDKIVFAQAGTNELPFPKSSFDIVVCLGVIQHTPSPEDTIYKLWEMARKDGLIVIDHYRLRLSYFFNSKPLWRKYLKRLPPDKSLAKVRKLVDFFFPLHWKVRNNRMLRWLLHRISPLIEMMDYFPDKDYEWHYETSMLESYDSLTDFYKHLRTEKSIRRTLSKLKCKNIEVWRGGNGVEARATRS